MARELAGLSLNEAKKRLAADGPNELPRPERRSAWRVISEVLREPMFALLLAGGAIYLILGNPNEALVLLVFATLSVSIAVVQELRSERVLEALRTLASPRALVIREGNRTRIPGREVVRGDILVIGEGDRIAADAIIRDTSYLRVDESTLTGESVPVSKLAVIEGTVSKSHPGGEGSPHIFAGTLVVGGNAIAEVIATGSRTEIGAIGSSLNAIQVERPRTEKEMKRLVRVWAIGGLIASVLAVILYGILRGVWLEGVLAGIALGMTMLPEEFPLVLTVFMVMGAWRISKVRVLTRRASAIEYLGATTVLCTDKTGTLTLNQMRVAAVATAEVSIDVSLETRLESGLAEVIRVGGLACPTTTFDPMELAIQAMPETIPLSGGTLIRTYPLQASLMAISQVWRQADASYFVAAKGAVEAICRLARQDANQTAYLRRQADDLAERGMRVIGVASMVLPPNASLPADHLEFPFKIVGLIGLSDPLREEVPAAMEECRQAGIRVVMVTGDYPATAAAIGRQAGIVEGTVLSGTDLDLMDDAALSEALRTANICARIKPLQKLRIVNAFRAQGEVVAMTGDGVNDAPSLKAADIGVAMGHRGTDVAREAASIVLLDDDFTSIVRTIRMGRRIYDNLRKAISFVMAVHILIGGLALVPLALGLPILFFPIHIAFLEMIIDPVCSVAFEAESEESDIMLRPPRLVTQHLFTSGMIIWAVAQGLCGFLIVAGTYVAVLKLGVAPDAARGLTFVAVVTVNIGLILLNRSFHRRSIYAMLVRDNRILWIVLGVVCGVLTAILSFEPLRVLFQFGNPSVIQVVVAAVIGVSILVILNTAKAFSPLARRITL